jgi:hypothetical protein
MRSSKTHFEQIPISALKRVVGLDSKKVQRPRVAIAPAAKSPGRAAPSRPAARRP